jgi:hypothetical protein
MPAKLTLEDARAAARERGGWCLSEEYRDNRTSMKWRCGRNDVWCAPFKYVRAGRWCPLCVGRFKNRQVARELARERGGRCLSATYVNLRAPMRWRCAGGHEWTTALRNVKHRGSWCPACAGRRGALPAPTPVAGAARHPAQA